MKKKIRRFIIFLIFTLSAFPNRPTRIVHAQKASLPLLSQMTEEESIAFIEEREIEIPQYLINISQHGKIIQNTIRLVEEDPAYPVYFNNRAGDRFVKAIKNAVNEYYGIDWTTYTNQSRAAQYVLQDSLVQDEDGNWVSTGGAWKEIWRRYVCYAYAINRTEQPPFYYDDEEYNPNSDGKQYWIGDFIGINAWEASNHNVVQLADYVKMDLEAIGYQHIEISTEIPEITSEQELICLRTGDNDYHFMRYDYETDAWYHKPGTNAVLKYKGVPSNDRYWTSECSFEGRTIEGDRSILYDEPIYYITYDKNELKLDYGQSSDQIARTIRASKDTMIEVKANVSEECLIQLESYSEMYVDLYDEEMEWIESYTGTNVCFSKEADYDTYYIRVNFTNPNHVGGVTVKGHYHTYEGHNCTYCGQYTESHDFGSPYLWINTQKHRASCSCGSTRLEGHAVSLSAYQANASYLICLLCGGKAESGFIQLGEKNQAEYKTGNGSFISSNGIVFLADEDIQSYLDHTLVWTISTGEEEA